MHPLSIFAATCGVLILNAGAFAGSTAACIASGLLLAPLALTAFRGLV
jgi:hypothetical protein